jgi:hypothetical protein
MPESPGLEPLNREQCLALLATTGLGRAVYTHRALPAVQPVRFVLHEDAAVFRTPVSGALFAAALDTVVALEADFFAADFGRGWYVTLLGRANELRDHRLIAKLALPPLPSWGAGERYLRVPIESVSGARIR